MILSTLNHASRERSTAGIASGLVRLLCTSWLDKNSFQFSLFLRLCALDTTHQNQLGSTGSHHTTMANMTPPKVETAKTERRTIADAHTRLDALYRRPFSLRGFDLRGRHVNRLH